MANKKLIAVGVIGIVVIGALLWASRKGSFPAFSATGGTNSDVLNKGVAEVKSDGPIASNTPASVVIDGPTDSKSVFYMFADNYFKNNSISPAVQNGVSGQWIQGASDSQEIYNEPLRFSINGHSGN